MSRKGMFVCKSKQIPRIFQRQRTTSNARSWLTSLTTSEDGISTREQDDHSHYDLLPGSSFEYQYIEDESDKKVKEIMSTTSTINKEYSEKTWNDENCQVICFVFIYICVHVLFCLLKKCIYFFYQSKSNYYLLYDVNDFPDK